VVGSSGWASVRSGGSRVFARAGSYESNPSHIDPAHVDVWIDGKAYTVDAGTYRYTAPTPWRNGLARSPCTTRLISHRFRRGKAARFLWLERPAARVSRADMTSDGIVWTLNLT
jgi:hypothetical protein